MIIHPKCCFQRCYYDVIYVCHVFLGGGIKWSNLTILFFADGLKSTTKTINSHLEPWRLLADFFACMLQVVSAFLDGFLLFGGFLKWCNPTTIGFPTKNDHFGVFWGYHYFRKHPFLCSCLKWGRFPFWNSNPLIYLLTVFISSQGCTSPKRGKTKVGCQYGSWWKSFPLSPITMESWKLISLECMGFCLQNLWICHLHDCWRGSMICFVWFWTCWIDPSILWSSFAAGVWTLFDETWKKILGPIRGKIQKIQWLWWLLAFRLGGYHKRQNHKSRNTFFLERMQDSPDRISSEFHWFWNYGFLDFGFIYWIWLPFFGTQVEHSFKTHKREILKLKTLDAQ